MKIVSILLPTVACVQLAVGYVIVDRAEQRPSDAANSLQPVAGQIKKLLELYYLVQVVRSYRRPAYQEPTALLSALIDRLTKEELRRELERLLAGVDGFDEVFELGLYPDPRDPAQEQLANDLRLLLPIVVRTMAGLRDENAIDGGRLLAEDALQRGLRDALSDFTRNTPWMSVEQAPESGVLEESVYVTEIPAASDQASVNDYDLDNEVEDVAVEKGRLEFFPAGGDLKYELATKADSSEVVDGQTDIVVLKEATEGNDPTDPLDGQEEGTTTIAPAMAVSVRDPEISTLIPHIIDQLRQGNVTDEEREALANIFGDLWPFMQTEAGRLRQPENP
ncbi:uncharacterized protein LOC131206546 [Anopheles bellator]|uniref:uncharacterized protein LOC131206546 n=1 Tax=Anopheles bellator TaxID=139047 RepID=UPI00264758B4|nr:uncharacterized protein LOC131206546 [Anopheles bellator]